MNLSDALRSQPIVYVRQRRELAELFGFETRNKYEVLTSEGTPCGFIAEQGKGVGAFLMRYLLGHWRTFSLHFFNPDRSVAFIAHHPFRFYFTRLEVEGPDGQKIGAIQRRFAIFSKRFEVEDPTGKVVLTVQSPFWKVWTFPFMRGEREVSVLRKKWSGALREIFTDADNFQIELGETSHEERALILAAAVYVDLLFFENNQGGGMALLDG